MKRLLGALILTWIVFNSSPAWSFCGFYVAKADTKLYNKASKVVLASDDDRHVITMSSDYQGDMKDFAIVIPVPTKIEREQININENKLVEHVDAYTAPRLVEYFDADPCQQMDYMMGSGAQTAMAPRMKKAKEMDAKSLGVKIEAEYTIGEYDIVILSAEQSDGLVKWLTGNGYKMPAGADEVLGSYIKQDMKFFLAKVNLKEQAKLGYTYLRPIQIAYESHKFMLPLRLGTLNANGAQELFIITLTKNGRVEPVNYRQVKIPSDINVPVYVKDNFGEFYKAMFDRQVQKIGMKAVFLEYAWDIGWCDPCAADPLTQEELKQLGVFWQNEQAGLQAPANMPGRAVMPQNPPKPPVFITRMHVRYDAKSFPEDIMFQQTYDRSNFQGRYIIQHPWKGERKQCQMAGQYLDSLPARFSREAENLASITGWEISDIRAKMNASGQNFKPSATGEQKWYQQLWKK